MKANMNNPNPVNANVVEDVTACEAAAKPNANIRITAIKAITPTKPKMKP